ncbi:MAG: sulfite exporter TauE/SafE family protein [Candidatus Lokiarchaeota archaeon]|nr:sulfite exporter TauE/SafE family protein [Candidatus Lokiarchaeota archaeon]
MELILILILIAFLFESMDSMAGMGFGTALSPLLFLFGYNPLQVVPTILISEAITGAIDTIFDHEFRNVRYSFRPLNDATKISLIMAFFGCLAIFSSILLGYFAIKFSTIVIKTYVAILVIFMGISGFLRLKLKKFKFSSKARPKMLIGFSILAGFNKGVGGGGYGPIITMGQIFSGVYEKSATAIVSFAESIVSIVGIFTFFLISFVGVDVDLVLLPSLFTGGFFAAISAPYLVRVLPNKIWKYFIPIYAIGIGIFSLLKIFIF